MEATTSQGGSIPGQTGLTVFGSPAGTCRTCGRGIWFNDDFHGSSQWEHLEDLELGHNASPTTQVAVEDGTWENVSGWHKGYDEADAKEQARLWAEAEPNIIRYEIGDAHPVGRHGSRDHDIRANYSVEIQAQFK